MKTTFNYFLLSSALFIGLTACHKHEDVTATINFLEPTAGDTLQFGEELHIEGTIQGDGELHGYTLNVLNSNTGQSLLSKSTHDHGESFSFHEHWLNNLTDTANVKISVEVEINHEELKTSKEINVVCLPN